MNSKTSLQTLPPDLRKRLVEAARTEVARRKRELRHRGDLERSLADFHRAAWPYIDPAQYLHNWHIDAMAEHLEAVVAGQIRRLIISMPPRCMKSLMVSVTLPAFIWAQSKYGALSGPHVKFAGISYDPKLAIRDALKQKRLMATSWYQDRWGDRFHIMADRDANAMYENSAGGFRFSTSVLGTFTGEGADIISVDDSISAKKAQWVSARDAVNDWWDETVTTRLNQQRTGAKIITAQRLHDNDLIGHVLDKAEENGEEYVQLVLPMEYDSAFDTRVFLPGQNTEDDEPFFEDPRTEDGELLWPDRFPHDVVESLKIGLGPFGAAAQLQQRPTPRAGGIIERDWWQLWPAPGFDPDKFPPCSLIIGSIDTAYGEKDENAWNAMTVWGVFTDQRDRPKVVLMEAWRARLPLRGLMPDGVTDEASRKPYWGLTEKVLDTIRRRNIDTVLIEDKTRGGDLGREVRRLLGRGECNISVLPPERGDKIARLMAVQSLFADRMVYAPDRVWAETVMNEVAQFPKSKFADYVDTVSQALNWLRNNGVLQLSLEADEDNLLAKTFQSRPETPYDV